jgi:hypothetical protein
MWSGGEGWRKPTGVAAAGTGVVVADAEAATAMLVELPR